MKTTAFLALAGLVGALAFAQSPPAKLGFELPPGFEIELFADDALASDIHSLTIDSQGRVVVAGKGYIKRLEDTDADGKADRAVLLADMPKSGARGLVFDGDDLICVGDAGVFRLQGGRVVGGPWLKTLMGGDHLANGIVKGPDGWFYLACGNDAGVGASQINSPGSPVAVPHMGSIVRISPDGKKIEAIADGLRNPYDLAFNQEGRIFTVDSDGERVHYLPYYTPNRLFDIAQGRHHGWVMPGWVRSWAPPEAWPDVVDRVVNIGRGSPTGVLVYRHREFPEKYRNGVFSLCWTFGRVYFFPMTAKGSTYEGKVEVFMKTTGDTGFAPTDMAVGPDGDLFISIGGRGTRGAVFRVRYVGKDAPTSTPTDPLRAVLAADQPLSSWSRAEWIPAAKKLGADPFRAAVTNRDLPPGERIRAIEILVELFGGLPVESTAQLDPAKDSPAVIARAAWALSRGDGGPAAFARLAAWTSIADPNISRAVWEALVAWPTAWSKKGEDLDWSALSRDDRRVRAIAIRAARHKNVVRIPGLYDSLPNRLASLWLRGVSLNDPATVDLCLDALSPSMPWHLRMEGVRLQQTGLGDVVTAEKADKSAIGYQANGAASPPLKSRILAGVVSRFPSGDDDVDRELARVVGMLDEPAPRFIHKLAQRMTQTSTPEDDLHYLLCLARIPGERTDVATRQTADTLNGIFAKLAARSARPADQVPPILEAMFDRLVKLDPALPDAIVASPSLGHPGQELFANRLPTAQRQAAARTMLKAFAKLDEDEARAAWTPDFVRLVASLPEAESLPILRAEASDPRLADTIALVLAEFKQLVDRPRFVAALASSQPRVTAAASEALTSLPAQPVEPKDVAAALRALKRLADHKDESAAKSVAKLLSHWTGRPAQPDGVKTPAAVSDAWIDWFSREHPQDASKLLGMTGADNARWLKRLDAVAWDMGDAKRGAGIYERKACFRCHGDARRLGPDLTGVAQRFSRNDLFLHIVDPSKDISPAYVPTVIATTSGKVYQGMLIYRSQELTLLQTSPDTTARIAGPEVQNVQPGRTSFMPTGLLDDASDADLADLYAFLKGLRKN